MAQHVFLDKKLILKPEQTLSHEFSQMCLNCEDRNIPDRGSLSERGDQAVSQRFSQAASERSTSQLARRQSASHESENSVCARHSAHVSRAATCSQPASLSMQAGSQAAAGWDSNLFLTCPPIAVNSQAHLDVLKESGGVPEQKKAHGGRSVNQ